jgi:serine/threonine protein kinase
MADHVIKTCYPAAEGIYELLGPSPPGTPPTIPHSIVVESVKVMWDGRVTLRLAPVCIEVLPTDEAELRIALTCVLQALQALHARGFVHRDVRWPNILKDAQNSWRLVDFELADRDSVVLPAQAVATNYLPPEVASGGMYTRAGDIYRVGKLLEEWASLRHKTLCEPAAALSSTLCAATPASRLSASNALENAWFA